MLLRHLLSILLLPCTVVVVVPYTLLHRAARVAAPGGSAVANWPQATVGAALFFGGFLLFVWTVGLFARQGRGTLAPWDPTKQLVATGPYRHVRNPMISGVLLMLVGEALFWDSRSIATWALVFLIVNHVYFVVSEEPGLERRFGEPYRTYKAQVPRWVPRLRPWRGPGT
ncbi:MAG TPA: isoprenylcysteine carboxylmethyltransferase family protein [Gemmatimonadales bacterium]